MNLAKYLGKAALIDFWHAFCLPWFILGKILEMSCVSRHSSYENVHLFLPNLNTLPTYICA